MAEQGINDKYQSIVDKLKSELPDFKIELIDDEKRDSVTISGEYGLTKGFDIDISQKEESIQISHSSKLATYSYFAVLGICTVLTYLFGGSILNAFGLVSNTGVTLRILYIIPVFLFLIPTLIVTMILMSKINPKDPELLKKVEKIMSKAGYKVETDL